LSIEGKFIEPLKKMPEIVGGNSAVRYQMKLALPDPATPVTVISNLPAALILLVSTKN